MKLETDCNYVKRKLETKSHLSFWRLNNDYYHFDIDGIEPPRALVSTLITPKGLFTFEKQSSGMYRLLTHSAVGGDIELSSILDSVGFYSASYSFLGLDRGSWFDVSGDVPKRRIEVFVETIDGKEYAVLKIYYLVNSVETLDLSYRFDRDNMWAFLDGYVLLYTDKKPSLIITTKCEYDGVIDGIPVLNRYEKKETDIDGSLIESQIFNVTELTFGDPPMSVFDPKQFLPPGVDINDLIRQHEGFSLARMFMIAFGVLLIIISIYMRFRGKRNRSDASVSPTP
ncbi:MAG: hypothetical protein LBU65_10300 [Planctomycetaceae bacterium]|nr:hypothetical protein [Planctomycetaceae bacterium]